MTTQPEQILENKVAETNKVYKPKDFWSSKEHEEANGLYIKFSTESKLWRSGYGIDCPNRFDFESKELDEARMDLSKDKVVRFDVLVDTINILSKDKKELENLNIKILNIKEVSKKEPVDLKIEHVDDFAFYVRNVRFWKRNVIEDDALYTGIINTVFYRKGR